MPGVVTVTPKTSGLVVRVLSGGEGGSEGLGGRVVDCSRVAARGRVDQCGGVLGEQLVGTPGDLQVVGGVAGGLGGGRARHRVARGGALFEGGQDGEFHGASEGGLAGQQAGQRGVLVHALVGENADGFQLFVGHQVGLVDDEDGGAFALLAFGQQDLAGLDGQPGAQVGGGLAEGVHDHFMDAADPDHRVGDVGDAVFRRCRCRGSARVSRTCSTSRGRCRLCLLPARVRPVVLGVFVLR